MTTAAYNWFESFISQYANSPRLLAILSAFAGNIDQAENIDALFANVWDVSTATGYGLDVIGRRVGVTRMLSVPNSSYLGFKGTGEQTFGYGVFWDGGAGNNFALSDSAFRLLILIRAASNISDGSIPSYNKILRTLFPGRGTTFVADNRDMQMTYTFFFLLTPVEYAILTQSGALLHQSGVSAYVQQFDPSGTFGFKESGAFVRPFGYGTFRLDRANAA